MEKPIALVAVVLLAGLLLAAIADGNVPDNQLTSSRKPRGKQNV